MPPESKSSVFEIGLSETETRKRKTFLLLTYILLFLNHQDCYFSATLVKVPRKASYQVFLSFQWDLMMQWRFSSITNLSTEWLPGITGPWKQNTSYILQTQTKYFSFNKIHKSLLCSRYFLYWMLRIKVHKHESSVFQQILFVFTYLQEN